MPVRLFIAGTMTFDPRSNATSAARTSTIKICPLFNDLAGKPVPGQGNVGFHINVQNIGSGCFGQQPEGLVINGG